MNSSLASIDQNSMMRTAGLESVNHPSVSRFPLHIVAPQGQLQIHTASFRGSFSIVLSEALRTAGLGSNVLIAQFLKGGVSQGVHAGIQLCKHLNWIRPNLPYCLTQNKKHFKKEQQESIETSILEIWTFCKEKLATKEVDRLVLDEIGLAASLGFINEQDLIATLKSRPSSTDVILTGPAISPQIIEMANQVTQIR